MRRAQSFALDLIIGLSLVLMVAIMLASFSFSDSPPPDTYKDASLLAGAIFSPVPEDWNVSTMVLPGFVIDHRLNEELLDRFAALSTDDLRSSLGLTTNPYINITGNLTRELGAPPSADASHLSVVRRFASHNGTILSIEVIAWQE